MRKIVALYCFFLAGLSLQAQILEVGVGAGVSTYWGDLNSDDFSANINENSGLALQLHGKYIPNRFFGFRGNFLIGRVAGSDAFATKDWQVLRNLSFRSNIIDLSVRGELYVFGYQPFDPEFIFTPVVSLGVGMTFFNPETNYQGQWIPLQPLGTEGQGAAGFGPLYSKNAVNIPFGAGVIFKLTKSLRMQLEIIAHRTFTDYLDDVSGQYVNAELLSSTNGSLAGILSDRTPEITGLPSNRVTGSIRGGADKNDYFFSGMVTISYTISDNGLSGRRSNYRSHCPSFK